MSSVASQRDLVSQRKRRRDPDPAELKLAGHFDATTSLGYLPPPPPQLVASPGGALSSTPLPGRGVLPHPHAQKRTRFQDNNSEEGEFSSQKQPPPTTHRYQRHQHPQPTGPRQPARRAQTAPERVSAQPSLSSARQQQPAAVMSAAVLAPCHICHRRPTRRSELDSFGGCGRCGERTCYICIRECPGWSAEGKEEEEEEEEEDRFGALDMDIDRPRIGDGGGYDCGGGGRGSQEGAVHHAVVCSQCCIERGPDGDVICLGCLSRSSHGGR